MRQLLCISAELDARVQWLPWFGRVPSHSNIADAPSRFSVPVLQNDWSLTECQFLWDSIPWHDALDVGALVRLKGCINLLQIYAMCRVEVQLMC